MFDNLNSLFEEIEAFKNHINMYRFNKIGYKPKVEQVWRDSANSIYNKMLSIKKDIEDYNQEVLAEKIVKKSFRGRRKDS